MAKRKARVSREPGMGAVEKAFVENFKSKHKKLNAESERVLDCLDICLDCKCPVGFADLAGWGGGAAGGAIG